MQPPTPHAFRLGALALAAFLATTAHAQVATGPWSSWSPAYVIQTAGSGAVSGSTFTISNSSTTTVERAERRYETFTSGTKQFEGYVTVNSLGGDRISLKQTYQDGTGPWSLIAVKKPGALYEVKDQSSNLAPYTIGTQVRINTVTYTGSDKVVIYINGSNKRTITDGAGAYYDKLGAYRTSTGKGPVNVTWSNIRFWQK